ncbi:hypothetical protein M514_06149 [Trichuris suis]|uniref:Uncharacterized protein n=1 Tax=Trichuris suis TaxID=68888 RepID=A0A085M737_9BILA|nr:hypothetical protein M513_06149 [Trichuris suis]KFD69826.1 hypothetical protein M514_06149 [Trichuris suis]
MPDHEKTKLLYILYKIHGDGMTFMGNCVRGLGKCVIPELFSALNACFHCVYPWYCSGMNMAPLMFQLLNFLITSDQLAAFYAVVVYHCSDSDASTFDRVPEALLLVCKEALCCTKCGGCFQLLCSANTLEQEGYCKRGPVIRTAIM